MRQGWVLGDVRSDPDAAAIKGDHTRGETEPRLILKGVRPAILLRVATIVRVAKQKRKKRNALVKYPTAVKNI